MRFEDSIRSVLERKGRDVFSIPHCASVYLALSEMAARDIGALLVTRDGRPAGIFSERDYARNVILRGRTSTETVVEEVMSRVPCVLPTDSIDFCLHLMTSERTRYLVVIDKGETVGMISIGDLVNWMISTQAETIDHLNNYIATGYPG